MPATMLSYNQSHELITQETYYNCGPGSSQLVLDARGIHVTESEMAAVLGTTEDGTPSIDCIASGLNHFDGESQYAAMWMPDESQIDLMRERIFRTIAWGRGCVANFVVPPSNYPRAVAKSDPSLPNAAGQSPAYGGGIVYHYVSILATDDSDDTVLIVDPGFQPAQYWVTVTQLASMVTPHGIVYSSAAPVQVIQMQEPNPPAAQYNPSDAELLAKAMGNSLPLERYQQLLPAMIDCLKQAECTNENRVAFLLANVAHETCGLLYQEEIADGSAYEGRADLGNTEPGWGVKYKGRGWLQLTGAENYRQFSQWAFEKGITPTPTYFFDNPVEVANDKYVGLSTSWYWTVARPDINSLCDANDFTSVVVRINGGTNGLEDRERRLVACREVAADMPQLQTHPAPEAPPPADRPVTCLTGRPHHHSENPPTDQQILDMRAENLINQAVLFAIGEKLGVDVHGIYDAARASF